MIKSLTYRRFGVFHNEWRAVRKSHTLCTSSMMLKCKMRYLWYLMYFTVRWSPWNITPDVPFKTSCRIIITTISARTKCANSYIPYSQNLIHLLRTLGRLTQPYSCQAFSDDAFLVKYASAGRFKTITGVFHQIFRIFKMWEGKKCFNSRILYQDQHGKISTQ